MRLFFSKCILGFALILIAPSSRADDIPIGPLPPDTAEPPLAPQPLPQPPNVIIITLPWPWWTPIIIPLPGGGGPPRVVPVEPLPAVPPQQPGPGGFSGYQTKALPASADDQCKDFVKNLDSDLDSVRGEINTLNDQIINLHNESCEIIAAGSGELAAAFHALEDLITDLMIRVFEGESKGCLTPAQVKEYREELNHLLDGSEAGIRQLEELCRINILFPDVMPPPSPPVKDPIDVRIPGPIEEPVITG